MLTHSRMDIHCPPRSFIQVAASYAAYRAGQLAESTGAGRGARPVVETLKWLSED
jgi:predicted transcriptional regulator